MLTTWFQKKAAPVRVEVKRQSIRLYPPLPAAEENNIIQMHVSSDGQGEPAAFTCQPPHWRDAVAS